MAEEVWVQLYIGEDKSGRVFKMRVGANQDINDLAKALAEECKDDLGSIHYSKLRVYKAGIHMHTQFPPKEEDELDPWEAVPTDTTGKSPLRVLAPGKNLSCFLCLAR
jgi:hypothetical protein